MTSNHDGEPGAEWLPIWGIERRAWMCTPTVIASGLTRAEAVGVIGEVIATLGVGLPVSTRLALVRTTS